MRVTGIYIYPIKATAAVGLTESDVRPRGLAGDRRWVVANEDGEFLHQRIHPRLATVAAAIESNGDLLVNAPGMERLRVARPDGRQRSSVRVWNDSVDAAVATSQAAEWFSHFMELPCQLLFMDQAADRPVAPEYGVAGDVVSFADAIPLLLATEASLADLNQRLGEPFPMSRFRPNVVVDGDAPWVEEEWHRLRIGDVEFEATHPCVRCVVTTIDQASGQPAGDGEPLKTLASLRKTNDGVCFGQNITPRSSGTIHIGDAVKLLT